jgi:small ligand-binding sensory domain FIST
MHCLSAISEQVSPGDAIDDIVEQLRGRIDDVDLAVIFVSPALGDALEAVSARLNRIFEPKVMLGAMAQGTIGVGREVEQGASMSLFVASMPGVTLAPIELGQVRWADVAKQPRMLREHLPALDDQPEAVLLLGDPFTPGLGHMLGALGAVWPGVPIAGGMAGGGQSAGDSRLLLGTQVHTRGAVGVALSGDVHVSATVSQGCRPIGKPFVITKSKRHIVLELAGRKALPVLMKMVEALDAEDRMLVREGGLLVGRVIDEYKPRFGCGDFLIRNVLGVDEKNGYVAINDLSVRTGQTIQFHVRDQHTAREDFSLLLASQQLHGSPAGGLLFSCNGRGTRLFDQPHTDATLIREALGDMPLAGIFAAGEFGPVGDQNFLHGHTASLMVFR